MNKKYLIPVAALSLLGCEKPEEVKTYQTAPVIQRDIVVSVEAAGVVEPLLTVEVKSKASGEILSIKGDTGDYIEHGALLVQIDKRSPRHASLAGARSRHRPRGCPTCSEAIIPVAHNEFPAAGQRLDLQSTLRVRHRPRLALVHFRPQART